MGWTTGAITNRLLMTFSFSHARAVGRLSCGTGRSFSLIAAEEVVSQIAVYAMVSAAIQRAREPPERGKADNSPELSFDDNPFVRSVLDPIMFARFSDGILQASLLRAAHSSELDYSASDDFSRQFTSDTLAVLTNHENAVGDAAIEYVYAFATRKSFIAARRPSASSRKNRIHSCSSSLLAIVPCVT